jgi:methyl-accepting chemotaxis protein
MTTRKTSDDFKKEIFQEINASADRFVNYSLALYFVFGLGISFFYGTFLVGITVGGLCLAAYYVTKLVMPTSPLYRYVLGAVLAVFTAQFIFQMHGMFEMHFFVFVGSTILIAYQNWRLQLPLISVVVVHHAVFAYLQNSGLNEIYFTAGDPMDLLTFVIHGALAAVIVGICGWWSYSLEQRTIIESEKNAKLLSMDIVTDNIAFAEEISKGNLGFEANVSDDDELGKALKKMQASLVSANKREQDEKYVTLGINNISEILRSKTDNLKALSEELIKGIVKYMKVNQGGVFLSEGTGKDKYLNLTACYAYDRKKFLQKRVEIGEGLLGQCFLERDIIYLRDVPKEYVRITSGLGDAPPANVLLAPIQTQEEIVGVLELASLYEIDENNIKLVKKLCEIVASAIISTRVTERVQSLFRDSQQQTEELRAQEEEVRQNMEEIQATQEEMQRKGLELTAYMESIDNTLAQIQFDTHGTIQSANNLFLKAMGYELDELIGRHHRLFVDREFASSEEYAKFWSDLKNGKSFQGEFKRLGKGGREVWISASYTPIIDQQGNVKRVIKLAQDITRSKQRTMDLERRLAAKELLEEEG